MWGIISAMAEKVIYNNKDYNKSKAAPAPFPACVAGY